MAIKYLTEEILTGFDKYKYNAVDTSPLSKYITHPFWNWVVQFCPRWVAPNLLTFGGLLFLLVQFAFFSYYDCNFYASDDTHPEYPTVPEWVWLFAAFSLFMAHTLDGIDGKQARRTGTGSALGELFDHGIDSWATLFMPLGMFSIFGRGDYSVGPERVTLVLFWVVFTFIVSHWEKYNTGVMYLPWGYDLSQIAMTVAYLITYFAGFRFFKFNVSYLNLTSGHFFEIIMAASVLCASLPVSVWNVYVSYRDKTGKMRSLYENLLPFFPFTLLWLGLIMWASTSSYDILRREPRLFYVATGTVFSNIACRLIVSGMSNTRCQLFNWLLLPLFAIVTGVLTLNLGVIELYLLWAYSIFAVAAHVHYGIIVVQQLAEHLEINVFTITKKEDK